MDFEPGEVADAAVVGVGLETADVVGVDVGSGSPDDGALVHPAARMAKAITTAGR